MKLSHKDLVKLGRYESGQGYSLNKIEADFLKKGIKRKDAIRALEEVDYYSQREKSKTQKEASKKQEDKKDVLGNKSNADNTKTTKKKSSFWHWLILLVLIGIMLYLYFSWTISFDWLHSITFK